jgi:hypothetical protein
MRWLSFGRGPVLCCKPSEKASACWARRAGIRVLTARSCVLCGDLLFGESLDPNLEVSCEVGCHHSRPGVFV